MARQTKAFGIEFSTDTSSEIVDEVCRRPPPRGAGACALLTTNIAHVVELRKSAGFRKAYDGAWKITIDGAPVYLYAKLRGLGVRERVTGADIFPEIIAHLDPAEHRPFFVVPRETTGELLVRKLMALGFAREQIGVVCPPFGFERDETYSRELAQTMRTMRATHVFFGVGIPKSEIWIHEHREEVGDLYAFAFGAALEFYTGQVRRAPVAMQKYGLEWAWRFTQDPRRLFRRYFIESWSFLAAIRDDLRGRS